MRTKNWSQNILKKGLGNFNVVNFSHSGCAIKEKIPVQKTYYEYPLSKTVKKTYSIYLPHVTTYVVPNTALRTGKKYDCTSHLTVTYVLEVIT